LLQAGTSELQIKNKVSKFIMMKKNFTIYIFILMANSLFAQDKMDVTKQQIKDLKEGVLIVNLPTVLDDASKFRATQKIFTQKDPLHKKRVESIIKEKIKENAKLQTEIAEGMDSFYHFSPYVIVYDTAQTVFFDKNFRKIDNYVLPEKHFYLSYKIVQHSAELVRNSFVLQDKNQQNLQNPFPWEIPYKFRRLVLVKTSKEFNIKLSESVMNTFNKKYYWKKVDKNPYFAITKMLEMKVLTFYDKLKN
jgi:hypothetical protein